MPITVINDRIQAQVLTSKCNLAKISRSFIGLNTHVGYIPTRKTTTRLQTIITMHDQQLMLQGIGHIMDG